VRRTLTIARREFATTVRRKSYLLATFGTPLFFLVVGAVATLPSLIAVRRELAEQKFIAVVDESGLLTDEVLATKDIGGFAAGGAVEEMLSRVTERPKGRLIPDIRRFESREAAEAALREEGGIKSFYVVPSDYLATGELAYFSRKRRFLWAPAGGGSPLKPWLLGGLLRGETDEAHRVRTRRPVAEVQAWIVGPAGGFVEERPEDTLSQIAVPFTFAFILMLSIFIASGYLIQGLTEELSHPIYSTAIGLAMIGVRGGVDHKIRGGRSGSVPWFVNRFLTWVGS
jgi:ABC-2 type transport system permease protein